MSSQLHSGFIWVQTVAHLLLPRCRVTSLSQSSFLELGYHFVIAYFCQKGGGTLAILLDELLKIFIHYSEPLGGVCVLLCNYSCLFGTFEYTKVVIYTVENVGGGIGQDPATEVTQLSIILRCFCFFFPAKGLTIR